MERFKNLLSDDCVWALIPPGIVIEGGASVKKFCAFAMGSRKHKGSEVKAKINNWFTDGDNFCAEYNHTGLMKSK